MGTDLESSTKFYTIEGTLTGVQRTLAGVLCSEVLVDKDDAVDARDKLGFFIPTHAIVNLDQVKVGQLDIVKVRGNVLMYERIFRPLALRAIPASFDSTPPELLSVMGPTARWEFGTIMAIPAS